MLHQSDVIPDGETLYKYAKPSAFPAGQEELPVGVFQDKELSCDWAKHQRNPEQSYHIQEGKEIIIEITVCDEIRNPKNPKRQGQLVLDWKQEIKHDPAKADEKHAANFSHSLIKGVKNKAVTAAIVSNSVIRNKDKLNK